MLKKNENFIEKFGLDSNLNGKMIQSNFLYPSRYKFVSRILKGKKMF